MKEFKKTLVYMVIVIAMMASVGALAMGFTKGNLEPQISSKKMNSREKLFRSVLPHYTRMDKAETVNEMLVYRVYDGDKFVGAAVDARGRGFNEEIHLLVGFDAKGAIVNYQIIEQHETEGLGDAVVDWFKTGNANRNIIGKSPSNAIKLKHDGGQIDAITSATYTSRYFLNIINKAYQAYAGNSENVDATSGATS